MFADSRMANTDKRKRKDTYVRQDAGIRLLNILQIKES